MKKYKRVVKIDWHWESFFPAFSIYLLVALVLTFLDRWFAVYYLAMIPFILIWYYFGEREVLYEEMSEK